MLRLRIIWIYIHMLDLDRTFQRRFNSKAWINGHGALRAHKSVSRRSTSAKPAAQTSSSKTCSWGEWLKPPRHRTNSMPTCTQNKQILLPETNNKSQLYSQALKKNGFNMYGCHRIQHSVVIFPSPGDSWFEIGHNVDERYCRTFLS